MTTRAQRRETAAQLLIRAMNAAKASGLLDWNFVAGFIETDHPKLAAEVEAFEAARYAALCTKRSPTGTSEAA